MVCVVACVVVCVVMCGDCVELEPKWLRLCVWWCVVVCGGVVVVRGGVCAGGVCGGVWWCV